MTPEQVEQLNITENDAFDHIDWDAVEVAFDDAMEEEFEYPELVA